MISYRSHDRWAPLRASLWFALGFVTIRLVYRIVFLGANGSGTVLWSGRPIHLDGPFRFISLFGPITTGGVWSSIVDSLPFAAGIVACGLFFALLDVRRFLVLATRARFARGILSALAIGVSTYPALVSTWRSMRQIHRLRRERGGFSTLGPLFERTLERASVVGESMEVRGFGRRSFHGELDCRFPAQTQGLCLAFDSQTIVSSVSITLNLGDFVLVTGKTGSGKSTLLRALAGVHDANLTGQVRIGGVDRAALRLADTASFVGYVPQAVRQAFVAATVRDELAFSLIVQGFSRAQVDVRLREVLIALPLEDLLDRPVENLSAGEAVLVAVGAALVTRPTLLLLDEPFADLDSDQAFNVARLLSHLSSTTQMCVVVAEHRIELLSGLTNRRFNVADGSVAEISTAKRSEYTSSPRDLEHSSRNLSPITALLGSNGAGKTTQLFARAMAEPQWVALVPENLADFFVRDTVRAECARSDRTAAKTRLRSLPHEHTNRSTESVFRELISVPSEALSQHPRDLSVGQQLALALAIQIVSQPRELLIDEPTRGLDSDVRHQLIDVLGRVSRHTAITVATHDGDFVDAIRAVKVEVRV